MMKMLYYAAISIFVDEDTCNYKGAGGTFGIGPKGVILFFLFVVIGICSRSSIFSRR